MACSTAAAFDIVSFLDRNGTLDEVPQNTKQKVATGLLLDKLMNKTSLGVLPVEPQKSWDRSVVIVLLTSCPT